MIIKYLQKLNFAFHHCFPMNYIIYTSWLSEYNDDKLIVKDGLTVQSDVYHVYGPPR